ncbi:hypothetical protein ACGFMO_26040 [Streptomyces niveus]|uniref:hypothetical protein n=1 Tax=Streptomyces niveus TaxID=193462 RepID=UPI003718812D
MSRYERRLCSAEGFESDNPGFRAEAADEDFWASIRTEPETRQGLLLEETPIVNATCRHCLTTDDLNAVRAVSAHAPG